jgi:dipeptidyl aminopeptidase/acylaminoacyl peptidase
MTRTIRCLAVIATMLHAAVYAQQDKPTTPETSSAKTAPDGTLVADEACSIKITGDYDEYKKLRTEFYLEEVKLAKAEGITMPQVADLTPYTMTREAFEQRIAWDGTECRRITYMSDGLKVKGFIWKPKDSQGKKLPLVIYNRGGALDFGKLHAWALGGFHFWVSRGFVVIASQYRGNDGGEGKEEYGGADLNDVMNLFPLAKSLGYIDMDNVFMHGGSRGGMMTYLALRKGAPVNAAVVTAGMVDLEHLEKVRPGFEKTVYSVLIPGYANDPQAKLRERSAVHWADKINTPLMILHGGADWRVPPQQALALAQKLQEHGKTYSLHIYEGDDHMFTLNALDSDRRALAWFQQHRK